MSRWFHCLGSIAVLAALAGSPHAAAQLVIGVSEQEASSTIRPFPGPITFDVDRASNGFASSVAIWPEPQVGHQARTAARSRASEIAANALIENTAFFPQQVFEVVESRADYRIRLPTGLPYDANLAFDFFLPPSFLEIANNVEFPDDPLGAEIGAFIRACTGGAMCSSPDTLFLFTARLEGSNRQGLDLTVETDAVAGVDATPLDTPTITDTRTVVAGLPTFQRLVEFPAFNGRIELGTLPARTELTIEYVMWASVDGTVSRSHAIAAINDPFSLDSDPVQSGGPVLALPVPEPSAWMTLLAGLLLLGLRMRRRAAAGPTP